MQLLGDEDQPHASFANLLHQLVGADDRARLLPDRLVVQGRLRSGRWILEKAVGGIVRPQQRIQFAAQLRIGAAGLVEIGRTLIG